MAKIYTFIYIAVCILMPIYGYSQDSNGISIQFTKPTNNFCITDYIHSTKIKSDTSYSKKSKQVDQKIYTLGIDRILDTSTIIYTVPVVVHVIHENGSENISDKQILAGIQHLNDAFNRIPPYNGVGGATINIQFCLAKQDPYGNFTSGINRTLSPLTNLDISNDQQLKNIIQWDPKSYINIWLVNEICSGTECGIAAYAYLAAAHGLPYDGIVNEARWFGSSPDNSKIHVHEMGHYFNLYHTFQNGCSNNNCLLDGDKVCDTPPDNSTAAVYPCSSFVNSCSSDSDDPSTNNPFRSKKLGGLGDVNDMIDNFMDYGLQQCQNLFTKGQSERMTAALLGPRVSLLSSNACNNPCANLVNASFLPTSITINTGTNLTFNNTSTGATTYNWNINNVPLSSIKNPSYNFTQVGKYTILLTASNGDPACTKSISSTVSVICPISASFTSPANTIIKNSSILFTNTSANANTYTWLIDGGYYSNSTNLNYTFSTIGIFTVTLIADNGYCKDTTSTNILVTDACNPTSKQNNIWYFGNKAGLDFNSGSPVKLTNGEMVTDEGCSVICDQAGNLLFYTSGTNVWNKNHTIMPNGTGLYGNSTSTQSAIIVPHPGNSNQYYIFTTTYHGLPQGLCYSIVDLTLSGGFGDVTTKNVLLQTPTTEKVTATKHSNNTDIWIITHDFNSSNFRTYLLNSAGLNTTSIVTNVGMFHSSSQVYNAQGYLTVTTKGDKIAISRDYGNAFEILDFNNTTGVPSNPITFTNFNRIYGLEFSPNGKILYASDWNSSKLYQFDLSGGTFTSINNSVITLASFGGPYQVAALKTGPDGKIYVAKAGSYIGRINFPNILGTACNYVDNAVDLTPKNCIYGLPNMIYINKNAKPDFIYSTDNCTNITNFTLSDNSTGNFQWTFGEPSSGAKDTSSLINPKHLYAYSSIYSVRLIKTGQCGIDTVQKNININLQLPLISINLGKDTAYCNTISLPLDAGSANSYLWNNNTTDRAYTVTSPGTYWVEVTNTLNCKARDTIQVIYKGNSPDLHLKDTTICEGQIHIFDAGKGYDKYRWNDGTFDQKLTAFLPGKYEVSVTNNCGTSTDSATLNILPLPMISFTGLDSSYCITDGAGTLKGIPPGGVFSGEGISQNTFNPNIAGEGTHSITYTYININGCKGSNIQKIIVDNACVNLFIPNLITPNSDNANDKFEIIGKPQNSSLEIYNRWGKLIYNNSDYDNSWAAENVSDGIYYYTFISGGSLKTYKGWVQVIK